MKTFTRYLCFQIPQWLILGLFLWVLVRNTPVNFWPAVGFFVFWVIKDFALYPFLRPAYERNVETGTQRLIGGKGVTHETLAPEGYIKIHGELWKAQTSGQPIPQESTVKVTGARGMTLIVEADDGAMRENSVNVLRS